MMNMLLPYIDELNKQYKTGIAREHSYRPALKDLLQSLLPKMVVTNEPAHFECGAPDYIIFTDYLDFHLYEHGEFVIGQSA